MNPVERRVGDLVRARLRPAPAEAVLVGLKLVWSALFGLILIAAIAGSWAVWRPDWPVARYDALFAVALAAQAGFLLARFETRHEAAAVAVFAVLGLTMEFFKVAHGAWAYPGPGVLSAGGVPLFVGFMYASVGLFLVRAIRVFDMRFRRFPSAEAHAALAVAIYANFFTMHLMPDLRYLLMLLTVLAYGRATIALWAFGRRLRVPVLGALLLAAAVVWLAENLGTLTGTWLYDGQAPGQTVTLATLGSWYLFLCVALAVARLLQPQPRRVPVRLS